MRRLALLAACGALAVAGCVTTGGPVVDNKAASKANVQLGVAYLKEGQLALAKEKLDRAEKQDPDNYEVYWAKAALAEQMKDSKEAERDYRTALKLAPDNSQVTNNYATFLCSSGEVDKSLPLFEKVIADRLYSTPYAAATNAGVCLRTAKRNADAQRYFERALQMRPDYVDAVVQLADQQLQAGQLVDARATIERYQLLGHKSAPVLFMGTRVALAQGDRTGADGFARLLRRDFPDSAEAKALTQLYSADAKAGA